MFLEMKNIRKHYGEGENRVEVLKGIDIEIEKGEVCVLLGPSGSGKSTLLNIIGGIDEADEGYIAIHGDKIEDMSEKQLTQYRRKHLGYVFQMYNLIPNLNIKENVETGAYLSDHPMDTDEILKGLGLYEHRHKLPNQLSGGQQQRALLARALCATKSLLLLDEPVTGLDPIVTGEFYDLIRKINQESNIAVVMVSHDIETAVENASHILHLQETVRFFGTAEDYRKSRIGKKFLGGEEHD